MGFVAPVLQIPNLKIPLRVLNYNSANRSSLCYDKDPDCSNEVCQKYPYTAKERCPKFCGLCHESPPSKSSSSGHLSSKSTSSHHQSSTLIEKESRSSILCVDKNSDCTMEFCRNYPFTAKERCAKTCGHCFSDSSSSSSTATGHHTFNSGSIVSGHHHSGIGIDRSSGGALSSLSPKRGNSPISGGLCFDRKFDCKRETCRDFPFTAREECAKTCGFCSADANAASISSMSSSMSSDADFGTLSPSRHASIRTNQRSSIAGSSGISHHPAKHDGFGTTDNNPSSLSLSKDKELECVDLNSDCNQKICKDYPFTAKERCAKTCGFCRKQSSGSGSRHSSLTDRIPARSRTSESNRSGSSLRVVDFHVYQICFRINFFKNSGSIGDCRDEDSQCSERSCLEHPNKARTRCAKTCGFCGEKSSHGSIIDLKSPSVDSLDDGSVITLDSDNTGRSSVRSTATSGQRPSTTGSGDGISAQNSQRSSISSRTDSSRKSSLSTHLQLPTTNKPYLGAQRRYPGRTGPCTDENDYCEKTDCYKYPRFAQRYCEKTCNYC
uniref:ShKT domain-containing protein n=1 Tax=Elaeophora elaphi TaxID=1147741 RepID=A0A0R3RGJ9_9BILA